MAPPQERISNWFHPMDQPGSTTGPQQDVEIMVVDPLFNATMVWPLVGRTIGEFSLRKFSLFSAEREFMAARHGIYRRRPFLGFQDIVRAGDISSLAQSIASWISIVPGSRMALSCPALHLKQRIWIASRPGAGHVQVTSVARCPRKRCFRHGQARLICGAQL